MKKIIITDGEYSEVDLSDTDAIAINTGVSVISKTSWDNLSDNSRAAIVTELGLTPAMSD